MAQVIEESSYVTIKFPLKRGNEETVRSINLPAPKQAAGVATGFNNLLAEYSGSGSYAGAIVYLFQPSNWRDTDTAEEAWQLSDATAITYEIVETTRTSGGYEPT